MANHQLPSDQAPGPSSPTGISRREFARNIAVAAATAAIPLPLAAQTEKPAPEAAKAESPKLPELSPDSQAEADGSYELLIKKYGSRFTDEQKADLKRLIYGQQKGLDAMRAYKLDNGDEPATVLKLVRNGENL